MFCLPLSDFFWKLGLGDDPSPIADWNRYLAETSTRLQPGVEALFDAAVAHEVQIGVVSAADETVIRRDASDLGIAESITFVRCGVEDKSSELAAIAAASGGPVLYLGDTEYDLLAAQAAGVGAIGFAGGYRPRTALTGTASLALIDDYTPLAAALRRSRSSRYVAGRGV
jgi:phosphoglycolate phosphatase